MPSKQRKHSINRKLRDIAKYDLIYKCRLYDSDLDIKFSLTSNDFSLIFRLIAEISPGKKGGEFSLPFGGNIVVPSGTFGKKDVVTCCMVSPSDRYKYQPPLT